MKKLVGVVATVALFGSGLAFAQDSSSTQQEPSSAQGGAGAAGSGSMQHDSSMGGATQEPGMGGSGTSATGSTGSMSGQSAMGQKELTGKVVKADAKTIYVDHMGAVVPLKVEKSTQFNDPTLKKAKDLQPGQEIRASYEVKETENVAKSISPSSGTGGSGDMMSPDQGINQGTGGTGMEKNKDVDQGTGGTGGSGSMDSTQPSQNTDINSGSSTMNPDSKAGSDTH
ncbi:RNA-binding protein [Pyxidicoccus parkwayensis]|uniref:RNA-binding protein n=1 Tax=Pyxidicoccus parkwayensis TaxID=2813578 RepID=A0ABX7NIK1_9BACT|nr:RNA-binding protein [Pyxidicoccus parkwaysis]QSQ18687.1 RNA-binding protein [Pyxidicoccus parkwaysis]